MNHLLDNLTYLDLCKKGSHEIIFYTGPIKSDLFIEDFRQPGRNVCDPNAAVDLDR